MTSRPAGVPDLDAMAAEAAAEVAQRFKVEAYTGQGLIVRLASVDELADVIRGAWNVQSPWPRVTTREELLEAVGDGE